MYKKINAAFIVMLFVLGIISTPVQAHFTLGLNKGTYDYHNNDFDPHGVGSIFTSPKGSLLGYVFPGAGPTVVNAPGVIAQGSSGLPAGTGPITGYPGVQSLYPQGNPGDGLLTYNAPMNWYQAESNAYAPFGAILTSTIKSGTSFNKLFLSTNPTINGPLDNPVNALPIEHQVRGDLLFAINWTKPARSTWGSNGITSTGFLEAPLQFARIKILIPPEFGNIKTDNMVSSYTNAFGNFYLSSLGNVEDPISPNDWYSVTVYSDTQLAGLTTGRYITFGNQTMGDTWYYIRINDVIAPTLAGKYFFKMCVIGTTTTNTVTYWLGTPEGLNTGNYHSLGTGYKTDGTPNWPTVLVKGEVDPAYADGTIRYGGWTGSALYGNAIQLPGRVRFVGRAIDPYTLAPTQRPVEARGYFNSSANGHFEVEGIAPGIYDIYASAAGYPEKLIQTGVTILRGQSYHVDAYLTPGPQITGEIFSKCGTGEVNWVTWQDRPNDGVTAADVKIEIFKLGEVPQASGVCKVAPSDVEGDKCTVETTAVSWSPVTVKPSWTDQAAKQWGDVPVQFQWPGYGLTHGPGSDSNGVGPEQTWQVLSTQAGFKFKFGDKGLYGAPAMWDGHVPQLNATWVDGLPAGTYEVKAFTYGYVQTKADGVTFEHVSFTIPTQEWAGDIYVPWDLRLSNYIKKEVHFHDYAGTLQEITTFANPNGPQNYANNPVNRLLQVEAVNSKGDTMAWKLAPENGVAQPVGYDGFNAVYLRGFLRQNTDAGSGYGRNYGLESDTYTIKAYMRGFVEQTFEKVTLGLCGSEIAISDHLYRGAAFNVTFFSKDWQHPTADKFWTFPMEYIYLQVMLDSQPEKQLVGGAFVDKRVRPSGSASEMQARVLAFRVQQGQMEVIPGTTTADYVNYPKTYAWLFADGYDARYASDHQPLYYPLAFESGMYGFRGLTYGYVMQEKPFQVYVQKGTVGNIAIKLVQGVQIPLTIRFKHEGIFEHLRYNSTVRIRLFDDTNALVAEWFTSQSVNGTDSVYRYDTAGLRQTGKYIVKGKPANVFTRRSPQVRYEVGTTGIDPQMFATFGPGYSFFTKASSGGTVGPVVESTNYVPRSTLILNVSLDGIPDPYASGSDGSYGGRYGDDRIKAPKSPITWNGIPYGPYGINGAPLYNGGYYVQVDVVPFGNEANQWYQPVPGLLYGESVSIDPKTGKLYPWSIPVNHIGPYQQRVSIVLPGAHLGGETSAIFELDLLGMAKGTVYSYTWCDDWRTTSWISIGFSGAPGTFNYYTFDGTYEAYLPAGTWKMDVVPWLATGMKAPGYGSVTQTLAISDGQVGGYNVYLEETGVPIPEFPTALVVLASALAAALSILRRRRK